MDDVRHHCIQCRLPVFASAASRDIGFPAARGVDRSRDRLRERRNHVAEAERFGDRSLRWRRGPRRGRMVRQIVFANAVSPPLPRRRRTFRTRLGVNDLSGQKGCALADAPPADFAADFDHLQGHLGRAHEHSQVALIELMPIVPLLTGSSTGP